MSARGMKAGISIEEMSLPVELASVAAAAMTTVLLDFDRQLVALRAAGEDADTDDDEEEAAPRRGAAAEEAATKTGREEEAAALTVDRAASEGERKARIFVVCVLACLHLDSRGSSLLSFVSS